MSQREVIATSKGRNAAVLGGAAAMILSIALASGSALAQDAKDPKAAPAAKADAAAGKQENAGAWIKLCEKFPSAKKDDAAKKDEAAKKDDAAKEEKLICLTQSERISANSGETILSVALRQIDSDKQHLLVLVPGGMILPAGVRMYIHTKEEWEKLTKEKVDGSIFKDMKPVELKFMHCLRPGCTAEMDAPKELVEQLKTSAGLTVISVGVTGEPYVVPLPLTGFAETYAGKPTDSAVYAKAKNELFAQIRQHQKEAYEKAKAEKLKELPPQPGAAPAAAPAAKPAEKK